MFYFYDASVCNICQVEIDYLTLFRMGAGGCKQAPSSYSPVASANIGISPQNFLTFSFNSFATLV